MGLLDQYERQARGLGGSSLGSGSLSPQQKAEQFNAERNADRFFGIDTPIPYSPMRASIDISQPNLDERKPRGTWMGSFFDGIMYGTGKVMAEDQIRGLEALIPGDQASMRRLADEMGQGLDKTALARRVMEDQQRNAWFVDTEKHHWWEIWNGSLGGVSDMFRHWSSVVGQQVPILVTAAMGTKAGRAIAGAIIGEASTPAPLVDAAAGAGIGLAVGGFIGGMTPMVLMEAGNFSGRAYDMGMSTKVVEQYAWKYGLASGLVEQMQQLGRLGNITGQKKLGKVLSKLTNSKVGDAAVEGTEEGIQGVLFNHFMDEAMAAQGLTEPSWQKPKDYRPEGFMENFAAGAVVGGFFKMVGVARRHLAMDMTEDQAEAFVEVGRKWEAMDRGLVVTKEHAEDIGRSTMEAIADQESEIEKRENSKYWIARWRIGNTIFKRKSPQQGTEEEKEAFAEWLTKNSKGISFFDSQQSMDPEATATRDGNTPRSTTQVIKAIWQDQFEDVKRATGDENLADKKASEAVGRYIAFRSYVGVVNTMEDAQRFLELRREKKIISWKEASREAQRLEKGARNASMTQEEHLQQLAFAVGLETEVYDPQVGYMLTELRSALNSGRKVTDAGQFIIADQEILKDPETARLLMDLGGITINSFDRAVTPKDMLDLGVEMTPQQLSTRENLRSLLSYELTDDQVDQIAALFEGMTRPDSTIQSTYKNLGVTGLRFVTMHRPFASVPEGAQERATGYSFAKPMVVDKKNRRSYFGFTGTNDFDENGKAVIGLAVTAKHATLLEEIIESVLRPSLKRQHEVGTSPLRDTIKVLDEIIDAQDRQMDMIITLQDNLEWYAKAKDDQVKLKARYDAAQEHFEAHRDEMDEEAQEAEERRINGLAKAYNEIGENIESRGLTPWTEDPAAYEAARNRASTLTEGFPRRDLLEQLRGYTRHRLDETKIQYGIGEVQAAFDRMIDGGNIAVESQDLVNEIESLLQQYVSADDTAKVEIEAQLREKAQEDVTFTSGGGKSIARMIAEVREHKMNVSGRVERMVKTLVGSIGGHQYEGATVRDQFNTLAVATAEQRNAIRKNMVMAMGSTFTDMLFENAEEHDKAFGNEITVSAEVDPGLKTFRGTIKWGENPTLAMARAMGYLPANHWSEEDARVTVQGLARAMKMPKRIIKSFDAVTEDGSATEPALREFATRIYGAKQLPKYLHHFFEMIEKGEVSNAISYLEKYIEDNNRGAQHFYPVADDGEITGGFSMYALPQDVGEHYTITLNPQSIEWYKRAAGGEDPDLKYVVMSVDINGDPEDVDFQRKDADLGSALNRETDDTIYYADEVKRLSNGYRAGIKREAERRAALLGATRLRLSAKAQAEINSNVERMNALQKEIDALVESTTTRGSKEDVADRKKQIAQYARRNREILSGLEQQIRDAVAQDPGAVVDALLDRVDLTAEQKKQLRRAVQKLNELPKEQHARHIKRIADIEIKRMRDAYNREDRDFGTLGFPTITLSTELATEAEDNSKRMLELQEEAKTLSQEVRTPELDAEIQSLIDQIDQLKQRNETIDSNFKKRVRNQRNKAPEGSIMALMNSLELSESQKKSIDSLSEKIRTLTEQIDSTPESNLAKLELLIAQRDEHVQRVADIFESIESKEESVMAKVEDARAEINRSSQLSLTMKLRHEQNLVDLRTWYDKAKASKFNQIIPMRNGWKVVGERDAFGKRLWYVVNPRLTGDAAWEPIFSEDEDGYIARFRDNRIPLDGMIHEAIRASERRNTEATLDVFKSRDGMIAQQALMPKGKPNKEILDKIKEAVKSVRKEQPVLIELTKLGVVPVYVEYSKSRLKRSQGDSGIEYMHDVPFMLQVTRGDDGITLRLIDPSAKAAEMAQQGEIMMTREQHRSDVQKTYPYWNLSPKAKLVIQDDVRITGDMLEQLANHMIEERVDAFESTPRIDHAFKALDKMIRTEMVRYGHEQDDRIFRDGFDDPSGMVPENLEPIVTPDDVYRKMPSGILEALGLGWRHAYEGHEDLVTYLAQNHNMSEEDVARMLEFEVSEGGEFTVERTILNILDHYMTGSYRSTGDVQLENALEVRAAMIEMANNEANAAAFERGFKIAAARTALPLLHNDQKTKAIAQSLSEATIDEQPATYLSDIAKLMDMTDEQIEEHVRQFKGEKVIAQEIRLATEAMILARERMKNNHQQALRTILELNRKDTEEPFREGKSKKLGVEETEEIGDGPYEMETVLRAIGEQLSKSVRFALYEARRDNMRYKERWQRHRNAVRQAADYSAKLVPDNAISEPMLETYDELAAYLDTNADRVDPDTIRGTGLQAQYERDAYNGVTKLMELALDSRTLMEGSLRRQLAKPDFSDQELSNIVGPESRMDFSRVLRRVFILNPANRHRLNTIVNAIENLSFEDSKGVTRHVSDLLYDRSDGDAKYPMNAQRMRQRQQLLQAMAEASAAGRISPHVWEAMQYVMNWTQESVEKLGQARYRGMEPMIPEAQRKDQVDGPQFRWQNPVWMAKAIMGDEVGIDELANTVMPMDVEKARQDGTVITATINPSLLSPRMLNMDSVQRAFASGVQVIKYAGAVIGTKIDIDGVKDERSMTPEEAAEARRNRKPIVLVPYTELPRDRVLRVNVAQGMGMRMVGLRDRMADREQETGIKVYDYSSEVLSDKQSATADVQMDDKRLKELYRKTQAVMEESNVIILIASDHLEMGQEISKRANVEQRLIEEHDLEATVPIGNIYGFQDWNALHYAMKYGNMPGGNIQMRKNPTYTTIMNPSGNMVKAQLRDDTGMRAALSGVPFRTFSQIEAGAGHRSVLVIDQKAIEGVRRKDIVAWIRSFIQHHGATSVGIIDNTPATAQIDERAYERIGFAIMEAIYGEKPVDTGISWLGQPALHTDDSTIGVTEVRESDQMLNDWEMFGTQFYYEDYDSGMVKESTKEELEDYREDLKARLAENNTGYVVVPNYRTQWGPSYNTGMNILMRYMTTARIPVQLAKSVFTEAGGYQLGRDEKKVHPVAPNVLSIDVDPANTQRMADMLYHPEHSAPMSSGKRTKAQWNRLHGLAARLNKAASSPAAILIGRIATKGQVKEGFRPGRVATQDQMLGDVGVIAESLARMKATHPVVVMDADLGSYHQLKIASDGSYSFPEITAEEALELIESRTMENDFGDVYLDVDDSIATIKPEDAGSSIMAIRHVQHLQDIWSRVLHPAISVERKTLPTPKPGHFVAYSNINTYDNHPRAQVFDRSKWMYSPKQLSDQEMFKTLKRDKNKVSPAEFSYTIKRVHPASVFRVAPVGEITEVKAVLDGYSKGIVLTEQDLMRGMVKINGQQSKPTGIAPSAGSPITINDGVNSVNAMIRNVFSVEALVGQGWSIERIRNKIRDLMSVKGGHPDGDQMINDIPLDGYIVELEDPQDANTRETKATGKALDFAPGISLANGNGTFRFELQNVMQDTTTLEGMSYFLGWVKGMAKEIEAGLKRIKDSGADFDEAHRQFHPEATAGVHPVFTKPVGSIESPYRKVLDASTKAIKYGMAHKGEMKGVKDLPNALLKKAGIEIPSGGGFSMDKASDIVFGHQTIEDDMVTLSEMEGEGWERYLDSGMSFYALSSGWEHDNLLFSMGSDSVAHHIMETGNDKRAMHNENKVRLITMTERFHEVWNKRKKKDAIDLAWRAVSSAIEGKEFVYNKAELIDRDPLTGQFDPKVTFVEQTVAEVASQYEKIHGEGSWDKLIEDFKRMTDEHYEERQKHARELSSEEFLSYLRNYLPHIIEDPAMMERLRRYNAKDTKNTDKNREHRTFRDIEEFYSKFWPYLQEELGLDPDAKMPRLKTTRADLLFQEHSAVTLEESATRRAWSRILLTRNNDYEVQALPVFDMEKVVQGDAPLVDLPVLREIYVMLRLQQKAGYYGGFNKSLVDVTNELKDYHVTRLSRTELYRHINAMSHALANSNSAYESVRSPYDGVRLFAHKESKGWIRHLTEIRPAASEGQFMTGLRHVNNFLKQMQLSLSFFHHWALTESAIATKGMTAGLAFTMPWKFLKFIFYDVKRIKNEMQQPIFDEDGNQVAEAPLTTAIRYGLMNDHAPDLELKETDAKAAMRKMAQLPVIRHLGLGIPLKMMAGTMEWMETMLWDNYHPVLKYMAYESIRSRLMVEPRFAGQTSEQLNRKVADYVNRAFGGLNWDTMEWANPRYVRNLKAWVFAPDWTAASLSIAGVPGILNKMGLNTGIVNHDVYRHEAINRYWPSMFVNVLMLMPAMWQAVGYALAHAIGDDDDDEPQDDLWLENTERRSTPLIFANEEGRSTYIDLTPLYNRLPTITNPLTGEIVSRRGVMFPGRVLEEGDENRRIYWRWGKQAYEVKGWFTHPGRTMRSKSSALLRLFVDQITGKNTIGQKLFDPEGEDDSVSEIMALRVKNVIQTAMPFTALGMMQGRPTSPLASVSYGPAFSSLLARAEDRLISAAQYQTARGATMSSDIFSMIPEVVESAIANGFDPIRLAKSARQKAIGFYTEKIFEAMNAGRFEDANTYMECAARLGTGEDQIGRSMKTRFETKQAFDEYSPDYERRLSELWSTGTERIPEYGRSLIQTR